MPIILSKKGGGGGGGGPPSGPAGGDLTGTYPNPTLAVDPAPQAYAIVGEVPFTGCKVENFTRMWSIFNVAMDGTGIVQYTAIWLPVDLSISSISFLSGSTALAAGTHQFFGLYDDESGTSSGTPKALLRGSVDDTSTAWAANSLKTLALTSSYTTVRTGLHYLAILVTAGTMPTLIDRAATLSVNYANNPKIGASGAGGLTALQNPATTFTFTHHQLWAMVS